MVKTGDGFELYHQVNFIAHVLLTMKLLLSLAKAELPRVTCTVSSQHYSGEFDMRNFNGELDRPWRDGVQFYNNNKVGHSLLFTDWDRGTNKMESYGSKLG